MDLFLSRDADSAFNDREFDAVQEWLNSGVYFHAMRDHLYHDVPILGGLWGLKTKRDSNLTNELYEILLDSDDENLEQLNQKGLDQYFLQQEYWPRILESNSYMIHASFHCHSYGGQTKPFPTRRVGNCHAGTNDVKCGSKNASDYLKCPVECREKENWIYC